MTQTTQDIPQGYKQTPVGIIPEDWEVKKIDKIGKIVGGGTPSTSNDSFWNGDINWFTPTEIKSKYTDEESSRKITEKGLSNSSAKLLPKNTILLTTRATIGEASIATKECCTNQGFQSIICNSNTNYLFLYDLINYNRKELIRKANGSTFLEISKDEIKKIKLPIPPLPEQEKIADYLTTWDNAIEKLPELIKTKKQYKKGLMQQLLTGKKRLDGFTDEWKEVRLGEVAKIIMGVSPNSKNYNKKQQGKLLIQGNADMKKRRSNPRYYTTEVTKECEKGDILMSVRAPVGEISKSIHEACIGRGICAIRSKKVTDSNFLFFSLINTEILWNRYKQGSTFESVNSSDIKNFKIKIPSYEEQTAIAEILSTADKEIRLLEEKLVSFKTQKKGLMQVLLTGKKRLV